MSILIKGIDMPEKHHMNGYYISDDGRVFDISRKNVVGKAIQYQREQYNKLEPKSAQPERKKGKWIPCSERLPQEEGSYLVTDDAGGVKTAQDDEFLHYEDGTPLWLYSQNVTAWMSLPEPYRGEQNE